MFSGHLKANQHAGIREHRDLWLKRERRNVLNDAPDTGDMRDFENGVDAIEFLISAFELEVPRSAEPSSCPPATQQRIAGAMASPHPMP